MSGVEDVNGIHKTVEVLPRSNEVMVDDFCRIFSVSGILLLSSKCNSCCTSFHRETLKLEDYVKVLMSSLNEAKSNRWLD
jgi:hypothetical protein